MEDRDVELIRKYSATDEELKSLWEDHVLYQKQVDKLESRPYRTPVEDQTLKQLKKQKLDGKTRLESLLSTYRNAT
jgi:uncharacterized protein YdcH (DUF465 family)